MSVSAFPFSFDAIYYHVKDVDKAVAFYRDVLGFSLKSRDYVARFEVDGVLFELVPAHAGDTIAGCADGHTSAVVLPHEPRGVLERIGSGTEVHLRRHDLFDEHVCSP